MEASAALDLVALAESVNEHILGEEAASWTERLDTHAAMTSTSLVTAVIGFTYSVLPSGSSPCRAASSASSVSNEGARRQPG